MMNINSWLYSEAFGTLKFTANLRGFRLLPDPGVGLDRGVEEPDGEDLSFAEDGGVC